MRTARTTLGLISLVVLLFPRGIYADADMTVRKATKQVAMTGYTRSHTTLTLSSEVSGRVSRVHYDVGDTIDENPCVEIDATFVDLQIKSTRQSLEQLKIRGKQIESRVAFLKKDFTRVESLFKRQSVAEIKRDETAESLQQANLDHDSIQQEISIQETSLEELLERHRRHNVYGPRGWVVVGRMIEPGETVGANMQLMRLSDFTQMVIPLSVSGRELDAIQSLPDPFQGYLEGTAVQARVHWVNPQFNEETRKLDLELLVVGYKGEHRGGLFFTLPLQVETEGLLVPKAAVTSRYENPRVTIAKTGEVIPVHVLQELLEGILITDDPRLPIGTLLKATGG